MIIRMRYPNNKENVNYDGKTHRIEPLQLKYMQIGTSNIYMLVYNDITLGKNGMVTLLGKTPEGQFYKLPLDNYNTIAFRMLQGKILTLGKNMSLNALGVDIGTLGVACSLDDVLSGKVVVNTGAIMPPTPSRTVTTSTPPVSPEPPVAYAYAPPVPPDPPSKRVAYAYAPKPKPIEPSKPLKPTEPPKSVRTIAIFYNRYDQRLYYDPICVRPIPEKEIPLYMYEKKACNKQDVVCINGFSARIKDLKDIDEASVDSYQLYIYSVDRKPPTLNDYAYDSENLVDELLVGLGRVQSAKEKNRFIFSQAMETIRVMINKVKVSSKLITDPSFKIRYNDLMAYFNQLIECKNIFELERIRKKHSRN